MNENRTRENLLARAAQIELPADFRLGTATAAYQIEGAIHQDGKGQSIWDSFSHTPGVIEDGSNGDVACDHYHRVADDVALMARLNANSYRFSLSWCRIQPTGKGRPNTAGLDFYARLLDHLQDAGLDPFLTLYHWDLPQALQDKGGWLNRDTANYFCDYVDIVSRALGDRVQNWTTFNEPFTFSWWGYGTGEDAPGLKLGAAGALATTHHALLAHGMAVSIIRQNAPDPAVGIVLDLNPVEPASDSPDDIDAARRFDGCQNRWYLEPLISGQYPADMLQLFDQHLPVIEPEDGRIIAAPIDYLGINIYRRSIVSAGSEMPPVNFARQRPAGEYTQMGWEVWPASLRQMLTQVDEYCPDLPLYISENGAAFPDVVEADGQINDLARADYLISHLEQAALAIADGVPLKGYFAWTLMDNFEWAAGYQPRFGLIYVDYETQKRTLKFSAECFAQIAAQI
jgi:beta-glucosidase